MSDSSPQDTGPGKHQPPPVPGTQPSPVPHRSPPPIPQKLSSVTRQPPPIPELPHPAIDQTRHSSPAVPSQASQPDSSATNEGELTAGSAQLELSHSQPPAIPQRELHITTSTLRRSQTKLVAGVGGKKEIGAKILSWIGLCLVLFSALVAVISIFLWPLWLLVLILSVIAGTIELSIRKREAVSRTMVRVSLGLACSFTVIALLGIVISLAFIALAVSSNAREASYSLHESATVVGWFQRRTDQAEDWIRSKFAKPAEAAPSPSPSSSAHSEPP